MKNKSYIPNELLKPFIKAYRIIESEDEIINRVLPNTSLAIVFRFKGLNGYVENVKRNNLPTSTFSGLRKSVRLINYAADTSTIIVLFREGGASAFFEEPLYELFEESVSLDNFINPDKLAVTEQQLAEAKDNTQRIAIIETFLLSRLYQYNPDKLINAAVKQIHLTKGNIKIKKLAGSLYISNDAFEKRFRKTVGTSPKQFSSIVRMASVINQKQQAQSLTDIAFSAGYYDQPHFNKEFKLFTGLTPTAFFQSPSFW
jgi:AraC-like DNA-binding protein